MKTLLAIGLASTLSVGAFAQTVYDSFDFGTGVPGRESIEAGDAINGDSILEGTGTWISGGSQSIEPSFGGTAGEGNGFLNMSNLSGNTRAYVNFDFSEGYVMATFNFTMSEAGTGTSGSRGIFFGFTSTTPSDSLMTNQSTDTTWVRIRPDSIAMRLQLNGQQTNRVDSEITFSGITSGTVVFLYDYESRTVTATVTGGSHVFEQTIDFNTSDPNYVPDLGRIGMNVVTMNDVSWLDVSASNIPEPSTLGFAFGAVALALAGIKLRRRK